MYFTGLNGQMSGLGFVEYLGAAMSLLNATKGGGSGGAGQPANIVSTNVNTQVSPQISPIFVQQSSPQNSPVNAGAAMTPTGSIPMTGSLPGFDPPRTYAPQPNMTAPLLVGAALLGVAFFARRGKKSRRKGRR